MKFTIGDVLNTFGTAVRNGYYKKIPYEEWRNWKEYADEEAIIQIEAYDDNWIALSCDSLTLHYRTDDHSMGEFLSKDFYWFYQPNSYNSYATEKQFYNSDDSYSILTIKDDEIAFAVDNKVANKLEDLGGGAFLVNGETIEEKIDKAVGYSINTRKENDKMKGFNFDFGPCTNDNVRMSIYGVAVKNASGTWVSYDTKSGSVIDVDVFNFDGGKYMFKMPVAIKDIAVGDVVIHNRKPMFVVDVKDSIKVIDIAASEEKTILPVKNMFGFDFVTKVVSLFNAFTNAPTPEAPFGNMLPFLMLDGENKDMDSVLPFLLLANGGTANFASNPMFLYFLTKDGGNTSDLLPLLFLTNNNPCFGPCAPQL